MKLLSTLFIIVGVLLCLRGGYHLWLKYDPNRLHFQEIPAAAVQTNASEGKIFPQRVIIREIGIDTIVHPAKITNNIWETADDGASYLISSPIPGTKGNSIVYAHNWKSLFGNLVHAVPGQEVEVIFADGSKKQFVIEYTSVVSPTQSEILAPSNDKRLTLYTCTGFLDSKRFVVVAFLNEKSTVASVTAE